MHWIGGIEHLFPHFIRCLNIAFYIHSIKVFNRIFTTSHSWSSITYHICPNFSYSNFLIQKCVKLLTLRFWFAILLYPELFSFVHVDSSFFFVAIFFSNCFVRAYHMRSQLDSCCCYSCYCVNLFLISENCSVSAIFTQSFVWCCVFVLFCFVFVSCLHTTIFM